MFTKKKSKLKPILIVLIIFIAGMFTLAGVNTFFTATNQMQFCTSCHSMKINLEEYTTTVHYKNKSGVSATCSDCHVPDSFFPKVYAKIMAAKDVYHWLLDTIEPDESKLIRTGSNCGKFYIKLEDNPELCVPNYGESFSEDMSKEAQKNRDLALKKFNTHRWKMANSVWDKMKESDSRECRNCHNSASMDLDSQVRIARNKHGRADDKGQTCIDCHKGIAHEQPDEPDGN